MRTNPPDAAQDESPLHAAGRKNEQHRLRAWAGLAIAALALAGSPSLLLAASRVPGVENFAFWPLDYFRRALVVHVALSIVVWTLACFGALAQIATLGSPARGTRLARLGPIAPAMGWLALPFLVVPGFANLGEVSLNNYVPVILHPLYGVGLALVFGGVFLAVVRLLANFSNTGERPDPAVFGLAVVGVVYLAALACFGIASLALGSGPHGESHMEELFWGGGHLLQFVNLGLMLTGLYLLMAGWSGRAPMSPGRMMLVFAILLLPALAAPSLYLFEDNRLYFSKLKFLAAVPAFLFLAFVRISPMEVRSRRRFSDPAFLSVFLSMALFALGGFLGFFIDGADTGTPGHYHGVLGAVNVVLIGLFHDLILPMLNRRPTKLKRIPWILYLYASGQALQCVGLFLAGMAHPGKPPGRIRDWNMSGPLSACI